MPLRAAITRQRLGKLQSLARAQRAGRQQGVSLGAGVRLGPGARVRAAPGGTVVLGAHVEVGGGTLIEAGPGAQVTVGANTFFGGGCTIAALEAVSIGADTMFADLVSLRDHDHDPDAPPRSGRMLLGVVHIGDRVWVGAKSSIVRGTTVSDDVVVGTLAVVRGHIPPMVLVAGVPARVIRQLRRD